MYNDNLTAFAGTLLACGVVVWILRLVSNPLRTLRGPKPSSFLYGNLQDIYSLGGLETQDSIIDNHGLVVRITGWFKKPTLYVSDPGALHHILVADTYNWPRGGDFTSFSLLHFGPSLGTMRGARHRHHRKILNPLFTQTNIRNLMPLFYNLTHHLVEQIRAELQQGEPRNDINVHGWFSRLALEVIGQGGIGYAFDALDKDTNGYNQAVRRLIPTLRSIGYLRLLLPYAAYLGRARALALFRAAAPFFGTLGANLLKWLEIVDIMDSVTAEIFDRKMDAVKSGAVDETIGKGKDIMSLLLQASTFDSGSELSRVEVRAFMSAMIFAGHETTAGALTRALHILAQHQDVQDKLRLEIREALGARSELDYEELSSLPYLHDVSRELLRLYPPSSMQARVANVDSVVPLQFPLTTVDGKTLTEIRVPKGTDLQVGIWGMNRSRLIWGEDAKEFRPERWQELPQNVLDMKVPGLLGSTMTFNAGPQSCIGYRFAMLEFKLVLSVMLTAFKFEPSTVAGEVGWFMGFTTWPCVRGLESTGIPQLPLRVSEL